MDLLNLKTLIEVAATGNISKAADKLCVTQSAASRRIKSLEEHCGKQLLDRGGSKLTLTESGHIVLEKAQRMLAMEKELLSSLKDVEEKDSFSFGCTPAFSIAHLPKLLKKFMLENVNVSGLKFIFDMPDKIAAGLQDGSFDLAIIEHCQCLDLSGFKTTELPGDEIFFISAPKLGLAGAEVTLDDLTPLTLYGRQASCCSRIFLEKNLDFIGRQFSEFTKFIVYDDLHLIINAVTNGDGIAFISSDVIADQLASGTLQGHKVQGFQHTRRRTLVENLPRHQQLGFETFRQVIFSYFGQEELGVE
jgi:DNA-binding transcriptional LysR family regulator